MSSYDFIPLAWKLSINEFTGGTGMSCGGLLKKKSLIISINYRLLETVLLQMLPVEYNTVSSIHYVLCMYLWGFSTFFWSRSIVKSLIRHMVCSEMPKACIWGVSSSASSIRRAHLGVMGMGGGPGVLSEGWGRLILGIGGTSEHHSAPASALFSCISDRPKSESCGVRSMSVTGGGPPMGGDEGWLPPASPFWFSPSPPADLVSFSSATSSPASDSWSLVPV